MTAATDDSPLSGLFAHARRADWGVGVLAAESDGKRRYLFEDGRERVLAPDFFAIGATYTSLLGMTRLVAQKLDAAGETPRDLWDAREFIAFTLRPAATLRPRGKPAKAQPARVHRPSSNRPRARP